MNEAAVLRYMGVGFVYSDYNFAVSTIKRNGLFLKLMAWDKYTENKNIISKL